MRCRHMPRIMLAATASGSGKTTVTCGILQALIERNRKVTAYKCGPDYIDPMFHSQVIGAKSRNLDLYMLNENTVKYLMCKNSADSDISVMEGVMGFYDGVGGSQGNQASAYHLAKVTKTPVILIVDAKGMSDSVAAIVKGFVSYRNDHTIKGVILNRVHPTIYSTLKESIERETGTPVLGYLPHMQDCSLESRHLGLVTASEVDNLKEKTGKIASQAQTSIDLDLLEKIANTAEEFDYETIDVESIDTPVQIAIAQDHAFCFYYQDALDLLCELGAQLIPCSPMNDTKLPENINGLFLGGGYPELYADQLSRNHTFIEDLKNKIQNGMPCYAECGGFMYLHENMEDENSLSYPMVGAIKGSSFRTNHLVRFGYIELTAQRNNLMCDTGETIRAHEFHYWDSTDSGNAYKAKRATGTKEWDCIVSNANLCAGYPHVHFYSNPNFAKSFIQNCFDYKKTKIN